MNASSFFSISADGKVIINCGIPFHKELSELFRERTDNDMPLHLSSTVKFAKLLQRENYENILQKDSLSCQFTQLKTKLIAVFDDDDDYGNFIQIATLYHDIGKYIEHDNHPQIGLYILRDFNSVEKIKLLDHITSKYFALLCSVLQHHDKFGVVQTGEASLPIFADIPYYTSNFKTVRAVKKNFSYVCLCNLLDIAATIRNKKPMGLSLETIEHISNDWDELDKSIDRSSGEREELKAILIDAERRPHRSIERITRLVKSAAELYPIINNAINHTLIDNNVPRALQCGMHEFAECFAHVAKLDYGLRFFRELVKGVCINYLTKHSSFNASNYSSNGDKWERDKVMVEDINTFLDQIKSDSQIESICEEIIIKVVKVLERFVLRYRWILKSDDYKSGRRIGFEMSKVLGQEKLTNEIINSLLDVKKEPAALNWIMDKTPIWSLD